MTVMDRINSGALYSAERMHKNPSVYMSPDVYASFLKEMTSSTWGAGSAVHAKHAYTKCQVYTMAGLMNVEVFATTQPNFLWVGDNAIFDILEKLGVNEEYRLT